jgi:hypothetical protein
MGDLSRHPLQEKRQSKPFRGIYCVCESIGTFMPDPRSRPELLIASPHLKTIQLLILKRKKKVK